MPEDDLRGNNFNLELNESLGDSKQSTSLKKFLFIGIALFAIFAGIIATMNYLNKEDNISNNLVETTQKETDAIKKSNPGLFQEIQVKETNKDEISDKLKNLIQELKTENGTAQAQPQTTQSQSEQITDKINEAKKNIAAKTPPQDIRNLPSLAAPKPSPTPAPTPKPAAPLNADVPQGLYIQVAAFYTSKPNATFLAHIKNKGYEYKLYTAQISNRDVIKVLIGPYGNRNEAKNILNKVKTDIEKDAFVLPIR